MSAIELSSLSKFYGNQRGIDGVSFAVKKGEILDLLDQMARENLQQSGPSWALTPSLWQRKKPLGWDIFHPTIT